MKGRSPQTLSCIIIKTEILLGNFSLGLINFVNLSTTLFYFFYKNTLLNVFYSWGQRFLHQCFRPAPTTCCTVRAVTLILLPFSRSELCHHLIRTELFSSSQNSY